MSSINVIIILNNKRGDVNMTLSEGKKVRLLDIFFRAMKGEFIYV